MSGDLREVFRRKLAEWQAPEPDVKAAELVALATANGWRHVPALEPPPETGPPTRSLADRVAEARAALNTRPQGDPDA